MSHSVTALVAPRSTLVDFAEAEGLLPPTQTRAGYWLLALPEEALDKIVGCPVGEPYAGFNYLFPKLLLKLALASQKGWIVYAETEYFGGTGSQGAAAFKNGVAVFAPACGEWGCINKALATVGVSVAPPSHDEFETVGLHERRFTKAWLPEEAE